MLQERLNGLAICSTEKDIMDDINLDIVLKDFALRNVRRRFFTQNRSIIFLFEVIIIAIVSFLLHYYYVLWAIHILHSSFIIHTI